MAGSFLFGKDMAIKSIVFDFGHATAYGMTVGSRRYSIAVNRGRVPIRVKVKAISMLKKQAFRASKYGKTILFDY